MTTPQLIKVVRIGSGEVIEAAIQKFGDGSGHMWKPEHLKKDGGFPLNKRANGWMAEKHCVALISWAVYDKQRELKAQALRTHIAVIREEIELSEQDLLDLYREAK